MIVATCDEYKTGFVVEGHAEYAEHGHDVVCASVSAMVQMVILGLEDNRGNIEVTKSSGYVKVIVNDNSPVTGAFIKTLFDALKQIAWQYPNNLTVEEYK